MFNKIIALLCAFSFLCSLHAENEIELNPSDANIVGHTIEKKSQDHLPFITIALKGTTIGTATDRSGHYYLKNLPEGEFTIIASAVGYKSIEKKIILKKGKTLEINFDMEEDAIMLDNIVVSANRNESSRREAASIVNVVSSLQFENTNSVCLAQGLNYQPGLRVEMNCQNCGFPQVRINGLEGPYTQILIDSRPIFSALAGVYGIEQIPVNMIDRVEVIRGSGSALFGSNAIAGIVNIITKEPLSSSASLSNTTSFIGGTAPDINTTVNTALVSDDFRSGISIFGSSRLRNHWDANGDGFSEVGEINSRNIGFKAYHKFNTQTKLNVEYHNIGEFRRGGNKFDLPPHETDITEQTDHSINSGNLRFDWISKDAKHRMNVFASIQHIDRKSYYGAGQNPDAYGKTKDFSFMNGLQYVYSMNNFLFMPADLTAGFEYSYNKLTDSMLGYNRSIDETLDTKSVFLQNEWKSTKWNILLGVRFDDNNKLENPVFSPRLSLRYQPSSWINLRAGYATGFRAPQTYDEDLHVTAASGGVMLKRNAADLKPEFSNSVSLSADFYKQFGRVQTNLLIEAFYTNLKNVFLFEEIEVDENKNTIQERRNGEGATVKGINLEARIVPNPKFQLQMGATFEQSRYHQPEKWSDNEALELHTKMFRTPDFYSYFTASYTPIKALTFSLSGTYTGSMLVQHFIAKELYNESTGGYDIVSADEEIQTPGFFDANAKIAYKFSLGKAVDMQLNAGVQNIFNSYQKDFDKGEERDSGYIYGPSLPRSFFFGVKFDM